MIGEALRLLRILNGYKSAELAEKLGISQSHVSEIENNKKQPTINILDKYARVFEMKKSRWLVKRLPIFRIGKSVYLSTLLLFAESLENDVKMQNDKKQKVALAKIKLLKILKKVDTFENE